MGRRRLPRALTTLLGLACLAPIPVGTARAQEAVTVFAAASLTDVFEELGRLYRDGTGDDVRFSFASSSTLARQIEAGAPAQVFASANEQWMDYLAERDLIAPDTRVAPIANRLVLVAPADAGVAEVEVGRDLDLGGLLGPDGRLAVGDPEHVPAGIYAKEALTALGLWDEAEPRLARADDVRAALALVERGEAPLGIVYATDARVTEGVRVIGTFPEDSHGPITYPFAILTGRDTPEVRGLFDFLTGTEARPVYEAAGFEVRE